MPNNVNSCLSCSKKKQMAYFLDTLYAHVSETVNVAVFCWSIAWCCWCCSMLHFCTSCGHWRRTLPSDFCPDSSTITRMPDRITNISSGQLSCELSLLSHMTTRVRVILMHVVIVSLKL